MIRPSSGSLEPHFWLSPLLPAVNQLERNSLKSAITEEKRWEQSCTYLPQMQNAPISAKVAHYLVAPIISK